MVPSPGEHPVPGITGSPWTYETGAGHWAPGHRTGCLGLVPWLALWPPREQAIAEHRDGQGQRLLWWEQTPLSRLQDRNSFPGTGEREGGRAFPACSCHLLLRKE